MSGAFRPDRVFFDTSRRLLCFPVFWRALLLKFLPYPGLVVFGLFGLPRRRRIFCRDRVFFDTSRRVFVFCRFLARPFLKFLPSRGFVVFGRFGIPPRRRCFCRGRVFFDTSVRFCVLPLCSLLLFILKAHCNDRLGI